MIFFKDNKLEQDDNYDSSAQKKFLQDMSYQIRTPLNVICGLSEIAIKNMESDGNREQILNYLKVISDSAKELQMVVNDSFSKLDKVPSQNNIAQSSEEDYSILKNLRILVVEDTEVSQMIVKQLLEPHGAILTFCGDGTEAIDLFEKAITGSFDIIFMDIKMPQMDGYEATIRIRNMEHPQAKSIPIIAMTAEAFTEDIETAIAAGMNAHIAKPYSLERIVGAIKETKNKI